MSAQPELFAAQKAPEPEAGQFVAGVDNGLDGAIVLLGPEAGARPIKIVMPTIAVKTAKGRKRYHNEAALCRIFTQYAVVHCFIEAVQARPDQHVTATINTGIGHGLIRGILTALAVPYTVVHARTWQAAMFGGLPKEIDSKGKALIVCHRLWPGVDWTATERSIRNHDGLCDAALICEYGRRQLSGAAPRI